MALRRGRPHASRQPSEDVVYHHLHDLSGVGLCIPLTALGETLGVMYLEIAEGGEALNSERLYLELVAENIGRAIANLQLRERLTSMARRDALTGPLNRRSLDEAINRHAERPEPPLACLMIDIDYFKRFNDRFGHDAGDAMQKVACPLSEVTNQQGDVFRFGGEEFALLLPGLSAQDAIAMAKKLRQAIERSPLTYRGRLLDAITISIGIASSPQAGTVGNILERADAGLLQARQDGRNRWVLSGTT